MGYTDGGEHCKIPLFGHEEEDEGTEATDAYTGNQIQLEKGAFATSWKQDPTNPLSVAPYDCAILPLVNKNDNTNLEKAKKISDFLIKQNIDFIIDDTDENFSSKIKKFNLLGIPFQIMIGNKTEGDKFEFKELNEDSKNLTIEEISKKYKVAISGDGGDELLGGWRRDRRAKGGAWVPATRRNARMSECASAMRERERSTDE